MSRPWPPCATFRMIPALFTQATPLTKITKGKSQEETWSTKKLFNMILENMSTWLPILFRLIKFPLGLSFPWDSFFFVFGNKSEKPQAVSARRKKKSKPNYVFFLNGSVLFTLSCYQGKYWVIRWNLLKPSVKDTWTSLVEWLVEYYEGFVPKVFALIRNCTNSIWLD